jgi:hypothetical protein
MAVSFYHQISNIDRSWQRQRDGQPALPEPEPARKPLRDWLLDWISQDADPRQQMDSLPCQELGHVSQLIHADAPEGAPCGPSIR